MSDIRYFESAESSRHQEVYVSKRREVVDVEKSLESIIEQDLGIP